MSSSKNIRSDTIRLVFFTHSHESDIEQDGLIHNWVDKTFPAELKEGIVPMNCSIPRAASGTSLLYGRTISPNALDPKMDCEIFLTSKGLC